jgi:tRNA(Ile)-lysidine synthase
VSRSPADRLLFLVKESLERDVPSPARAVLAVSGGADSVAMLRAWHAIRQGSEDRVVVASFDHGLRPESAADVEFVRQLAGRLGFDFVKGSPERAIEKGRGDSIESAARRERYAFLSKVADDHGASVVLTAHTADDQIETVLFQIVRGTGLAGLAGIPTRRPLAKKVDLVRPLLDVRRREVESYLSSIDQAFVNDLTNQSLSFARNQIRHVILPLIRDKVHGGVDQSLLRLAATAREEWDSLEQDVKELLDGMIVERKERELILSADRLSSVPGRVAGRLLREAVVQVAGGLREIGWSHIQDGLRLLDSAGPRRVEWPLGLVLEKLPDGKVRLMKMGLAIKAEPSRQSSE